MAAAQRNTVPVIEDERKIARWVQTYLEQAGFEVLLAGNGETGFALAQFGQPDLVTGVRRKIEPDPTDPTRIVTVYGVGYRYDG